MGEPCPCAAFYDQAFEQKFEKCFDAVFPRSWIELSKPVEFHAGPMWRGVVQTEKRRLRFRPHKFIIWC